MHFHIQAIESKKHENVRDRNGTDLKNNQTDRWELTFRNVIGERTRSRERDGEKTETERELWAFESERERERDSFWVGELGKGEYKREEMRCGPLDFMGGSGYSLELIWRFKSEERVHWAGLPLSLSFYTLILESVCFFQIQPKLYIYF